MRKARENEQRKGIPQVQVTREVAPMKPTWHGNLLEICRELIFERAQQKAKEGAYNIFKYSRDRIFDDQASFSGLV